MPPSNASSATLAFFHWPKASVSGALESLPSALILAKAGDSCSDSRIQIDTPSRKIETRNGMRQPQALKASARRCVRRRPRDDDQREEQAERSRLFESTRCSSRAGPAAHARRHRSRRAAVFAAEREALQQAADDEMPPARRCRSRHSSAAGRPGRWTGPSSVDGDEEGVLAADEIAQAAEQQGAEGRTAKPAAKPSSAKMKPAVGDSRRRRSWRKWSPPASRTR